jgi:2-oxo-4-hydroxy-4-carboxy-5-ureidoimidazoline decarboxylase
MTLDELNHLDAPRADAQFMRCCGSTRWAAAMTSARPFATLDAMRDHAARIWTSLGKPDWLEAFAAHPKIGEQRSVSAWSTAEQAGMAAAGDDVRGRLAALNAAYEARFGYIFIVCATGRTPEEMLTLVDARLTNDPAVELPIAAAEQGGITALRLAKLLDAHQ